MNKAEKIQYLVEVLKTGAGGTEAAREFKIADEAAARTNQGLNTLAKTVGVVAVAFGSYSVIKDWVREAGAAEQANAKLAGTLRSTGQFSNEYFASLRELATALEKVTTASDETIAGITTQLVAFGAARSEIPKLTEVILDMAAAGQDAGTATQAIGAALNGNFSGLQRLLKVTFDEGKSSAENFADALDLLEKRFGGMARALGATEIGRIEQTKNAISNLKEELGAAVLQGAAPFVLGARDAANSLNEWAGSATYARTVIADGMIAIAGGLSAVGVALAVVRANAAFDLIFGGAAVRSVRDLAAATQLLATANASFAASASVGMAGFVAVVWTGVEAYKALRAQMDAAKAAANLGVMNAKFRDTVEADITTQLEAGKISEAQATAMRQRIATAFTPIQKSIPPSSSGKGPARPGYSFAQRDEDAEHAALRSVFGELHPELATKTAAQKQIKEEQQQALRELIKLYDQMQIAALTGIEREEAEAVQSYQLRGAEIEALSRKAMISSDERARYEQQNEETLHAQIQAIATKGAEEQKQAAQQLREFEQQLQLATLQGFERERLEALLTYEKRKEYILSLSALSDEQREKLLDLTKAAASAEEASITKRQLESMGPSSDEFYEAQKAKADKYAQMKPAMQSEFERLTMSETEILQIETERRKELVTDYYNFMIEQARAAGQETRQLEEQKTKHLTRLTEQATDSQSKLITAVGDLGVTAARQFASGMSQAFTAIITGSQSAGEALRDFFVSFLQKVAELIIQLLILLAIEIALGWAGYNVNLVPRGTRAAKGGIFKAAKDGGVFSSDGDQSWQRMAAGGVVGVSMTSGTTYLPRFGVMAGEAGPEALAVLAQPYEKVIAGMNAMVGMAEGRRMMILPADDAEKKLMRAAAVGLSPLGNNARWQSASSKDVPSTEGARDEVLIRLAPGLEAELVNKSVERSVVRVVREVGHDTPMNQAVRRAVQ